MAKTVKSAAELAFEQRMSDPGPFGIDDERDDTTRVALKALDIYSTLVAKRDAKPRLKSFAFLDGGHPYSGVLEYRGARTTLQIFDANGDLIAKSSITG